MSVQALAYLSPAEKTVLVVAYLSAAASGWSLATGTLRSTGFFESSVRGFDLLLLVLSLLSSLLLLVRVGMRWIYDQGFQDLKSRVQLAAVLVAPAIFPSVAFLVTLAVHSARL